jgi:hypothetical protein
MPCGLLAVVRERRDVTERNVIAAIWERTELAILSPVAILHFPNADF